MMPRSYLLAFIVHIKAERSNFYGSQTLLLENLMDVGHLVAEIQPGLLICVSVDFLTHVGKETFVTDRTFIYLFWFG